MKKSITRIMAALALLVTLAIPMGVWGQTASFAPSDFNGQGTSGTGSAISATIDGVTFACDKGYGTTQIRCYSGGVITISSSNTITAISFTFSGSYTGGMETSYTSLSTTSWTKSLSSQARIMACSVSYTGGDTPQPTTYTVTYECNGGTSGCPQNVTGIEPNTQIQLADAPSKDGFDFDGWSDGNTTYGENEDYTVTGNVTFTAQWTENTTPTPGGETATLNIEAYADANNWVNGTKYATATVSPVTFTAIGGGNTGKYYTSGEEWRFYQSENASITISVAEGYTLVSVIPTYNVSNNGVLKNGNSTIASGSTVAVSGTTVTFTVGNSGSATNGQVKFTNIDVVYVSNGGVLPPSITAANVDIEYNATSGSITYTINNEVDGGTVTASTTADWITLGNNFDSPIAFTCTANEAGTARTATVTLTYTYNRETVTKDVTVTQAAAPVVYNTMQAIFDKATEVGNTATSVNIALQNWVVSGVSTNGKNVFVTDGTKGFVIFNTDGNMGFAVGNVLSGTVSCKVQLYHGFAEITELNSSTEGISIATGGTVTEANIAMAELAGVNTSALVSYNNLTCSVTTSGNNTFYNLSDGTTTIQVYNSLYAFDALIDGKTYNITGIYQQYNNTKEILPRSADDIVEVVSAEPSITVNPDLVEVNADEHDGTLDLTYENLEISDMTDFAIQYYDAESEEAETPDWIEVTIAEQDPSIGEGYVVSYYMEENEGPDARTAYFKVYAMDDETNLVYSNLVTISQAAPVVPPTGDEYALYAGELVDGDYLIVYGGGAMNTTVTSDRLQYEDVTVNNDVIVTDNAEIVWHIAKSGDYWTIYNADADAYAASTGVKNKAQMLADGTDDKALWTVSGTETYEFVNKFNTANSVNANLRKNGTYGFACYATSTGGALSLYKKVAEPITETYTLEIAGYEAGSDGGYYLIASPVTVNPANVEGMTDGEYDLYSFDQAEADEWRNYKVNAFNLEPGKGYLYAKQATEPEEVFHFELTGTPYNGEPIRLSKSDNVDFPGWNLVGNPFGQTAYIDRDFYVMKSDGSEIIESETDEIAPMQGIFVIAANDDEELTFSTEAPTTTDGKIVMNVSNARRSVVDRATVRFGEGRTLPKFMFNPNSTKLYIDQNGEDFAVVRSIDENATPVSFHAAENGTYTLSINAENVEMEYLHLLDNMTGADVDLLATPSYTFEARTTDYANRFKLVYATTTDVNENNVEPFAFFNGSEWVINNEGEATLQVIDINGRMLSNETVNGNANVNINATSGIYMLRLVNGESVKTQKVVVK